MDVSGPPESADAVVIGAGIAGCALAWRLVEAGRRVVVVDPAAGSGASGNAWALLHAPSGQGLENDLLREAWRLAQHAMSRLDLPANARVHAADGSLAALMPMVLCKDLLASGGARLVQVQATVLAIHRDAVGWRVLLNGGLSQLHCSDLILANGLSAAALWPPLHPLLSAVRGQVDTFAAPAESEQRVLRHADGYAVGGRGGQWLVGASFQPGRCDQQVDAVDTAANRIRLATWLQLAPDDLAHLGGRAAIRVVSRDRRPLAGPAMAAAGGWTRDGWPRCEPGLWLSLAHGAHGFTSAFLAAELLVARLSAHRLKLSPAMPVACDPRRFGRR